MVMFRLMRFMDAVIVGDVLTRKSVCTDIMIKPTGIKIR